jgi:hypothetical protein
VFLRLQAKPTEEEVTAFADKIAEAVAIMKANDPNQKAMPDGDVDLPPLIPAGTPSPLPFKSMNCASSAQLKVH